MRRLLMGVALLLLVGCNETPAEPVETTQVELRASSFQPQTVTVTQGTEVMWINTLAIAHTITPVQHTQWERQEMNNNGQTFVVRLDVPGTYPYECELHAGMEGTIIVTPE